MKAQHGFTLIEIMVVVVILAILGSIALPAYLEHVTRGKIPQATSSLVTKRTQMEQFYQDNRTYVGAPACNADTASSAYFDFSCAAVATDTYTLQAVGKDTMTDFTFTVTEANSRATTSVPAGWTGSATCWIRGKGGVC